MLTGWVSPLVRSADEFAAVDGGEMALSLPFELPNQRLFRGLDVDVGVLALGSVVVSREFWEGVSSAGGAISTSSASRHHFLLRVYRSQPSWPRRPSFHYFARLVGTDTMRPQKSMCSPCYQSRSNLHRPATWNQLYYLAHQRPQYAIHCLQPSATWHFHFASRAVRIRPSTEQC